MKKWIFALAFLSIANELYALTPQTLDQYLGSYAGFNRISNDTLYS